MAAPIDWTSQISLTRSSGVCPARMLFPKASITRRITGASAITSAVCSAPAICSLLRGRNASPSFSRRIPRRKASSISSFSLPWTTMNLQGCLFLAEGALIPLWITSAMSSREIGASKNLRMLRLS